MIFRIKLAVLFGGAALAWMGYQEFVLSQGASTEPTVVDLHDLENGASIDNPHLAIGPHWVVSDGCIFEYESDDFLYSGYQNDTRLNYAYFPIISEQHPYNVAIDALAQKYGSYEAIPDEEWPPFGNFRVLVKTRQYDTYGDLPDYWLDNPSVTGLVINRISQLDEEEAALILAGFPDLDLEQVLILEEGRSPRGPLTGLGMIGGGVLLFGGGARWLFHRGS